MSVKAANNLKSVMCLLAFLRICEYTSEAVVYVDRSKAGGNGTSWAQAYKTVEAALAASGAGQEFWIARGTYTPAYVLYLASGTKLYGGFNGTETQLSQRNVSANQTILDGQLSLRHLIFINSAASNCRVDGLTIMRGRATGAAGWDAYGGGIVIDQQSPVIANCVFSDNFASTYGGAVMVNRAPAQFSNCSFLNNGAPSGGGIAGYDADITVSDSLFRNNVGTGAQGRGAGIWLYQQSPSIINSSFAGNSAYQGGGIEVNSASLASISGCSFSNNTAAHAGGAIGALVSTVVIQGSTFRGNSSGDNGGGYWSYYSPSTVRDSTFWQNHASAGGAVQFDYKTASVSLVERCRFLGNTASSEGGALHSYAQSTRIESSVFSGNSSVNGGAIRAHAGSGGDYNTTYQISLRNCVVYGNDADSYGGGMINSGVPNVLLYNSVFWGNTAGTQVWDANRSVFVTAKDIFNSGSGGITTRYCDLETLTWYHGASSESHTGSWSSNPLFVDGNGSDNALGTLDDNLQLQSGSSCIDHADGNYAPSADIVLTPRVDLTGIANTGTGSPNYADVGAFESAPKVATPTFSPDGGAYNNVVSVNMQCATAGSTIRYTLDGSTPTANSPAGTTVFITSTTTLKARAYHTGYAESDVKTAVYTMVDSDNDGLADWVETDTGNYVSPTDTGSDPQNDDSDNDGYRDGLEVARGTDPNDADSHPSFALYDFDGDGRADVAVYRQSAGQWSIRESQSGNVRQQQFGWSAAQPVPADYDGDGKTDIAVYHQALGNWYILNSGNGSVRQQQFGWSAAVPVPGDYDADGRADIAVYHQASGTWYIQYSGNGTVRVQQFGWSQAGPVPGDYDGDGRADMAVYYPTQGKWSILNSGDNRIREQLFGWSASKPVPGDFDGDGRTDIAVFHQALGNWYIQNSGNGSIRQQQFGWSASDPVQADYDGDGRFDIGVYYPAQGGWYLETSGGGSGTTAQLGSSSSLPARAFYGAK